MADVKDLGDAAGRGARFDARGEPVNVNTWPDPTELAGLPPVPQWTDLLLPDALRGWLSDIADRTQCPPEYPAVGAMVALASVVGRGCAIRPKRHDDWIVVPNLWGAAVGPPSAMKTPALREALRPLTAIAGRASEEYAARAFEREALDAQRKALARQMEKVARDGDSPDELRARFEALAAESAKATAERRYVVYDTTVEKLGEIMRCSPRGVLLFRDELTGWLGSLERQGHECDRALYLEAWNGDGEFVYDRIGRGTLRLQACVSILGGIQPGPLSAYLRDALAGGAGADGLVQRFQMLVYPEQLKDWRNVDRWPDSAARNRALTTFERLALAAPHALGADQGETIPFVRFDEPAQEFFDAWRADLETKLRRGGEHEAVEAHLAKYRKLMPSLALLSQLCDHGRGPVGLAACQRAAAWCDLLEGHARRVYASATVGAHGAARALLTKIRAGRLQDPFTARDVYLSHWSGLTGTDVVDSALATLEDHGWVRRVTVQTGGRPGVKVHIHPSITRQEAAE